MKPVKQLTTAEIHDRLSIAVYYGAALQAEIHANSRAREAAETLIDELRQEEFLRDQLETTQQSKQTDTRTERWVFCESELANPAECASYDELIASVMNPDN